MPCLAALAILAAAGCREHAAWPPAEAAKVELGEDTCSTCRMIISDERYGAERFDRQGKAELFDDLGCLLERTSSAGEAEPEAIFVRSFTDGKWIRGNGAIVVHARGVASPMGHGYVAFETMDAARTEAARWNDAEVAQLPDLLRHAVRAAPGQHPEP